MAIDPKWLLREWRDARQAIFDTDMSVINDATKALWERLGNAEHALMDYARTLN